MVSERERRMAVLGPHVLEGVPLAQAAADAGVARRTAQRWLADYTADGSTARSGRSDRARRRRIPVELVNLIEGMALRRPPPKIAQVHREAARIATEKGWAAPSYPVVYRIIAGLAVMYQERSIRPLREADRQYRQLPPSGSELA